MSRTPFLIVLALCAGLSSAVAAQPEPEPVTAAPAVVAPLAGLPAPSAASAHSQSAPTPRADHHRRETPAAGPAREPRAQEDNLTGAAIGSGDQKPTAGAYPSARTEDAEASPDPSTPRAYDRPSGDEVAPPAAGRPWLTYVGFAAAVVFALIFLGLHWIAHTNAEGLLRELEAQERTLKMQQAELQAQGSKLNQLMKELKQLGDIIDQERDLSYQRASSGGRAPVSRMVPPNARPPARAFDDRRSSAAPLEDDVFDAPRMRPLEGPISATPSPRPPSTQEVVVAFNALAANPAPAKIDSFAEAFAAERVALGSDGRFVMSAESQDLWFVPSGFGAGEGLLLPGPKTLQTWVMFFQTLNGEAAKRLMGAAYDMERGESLFLLAPASVSKAGGELRIAHRGQLRGI
jgi:hypothetical protein